MQLRTLLIPMGRFLLLFFAVYAAAYMVHTPGNQWVYSILGGLCMGIYVGTSYRPVDPETRRVP